MKGEFWRNGWGCVGGGEGRGARGRMVGRAGFGGGGTGIGVPFVGEGVGQSGTENDARELGVSLV